MLGNLGEAVGTEQRIEYLWPGNVNNWRYWQSIQTQWRSGMGGATGLDYAGVLACLRNAHGLHGKRLRKAFACLQAAERATLEVWAEQASADKAQQH